MIEKGLRKETRKIYQTCYRECLLIDNTISTTLCTIVWSKDFIGIEENTWKIKEEESKKPLRKKTSEKRKEERKKETQAYKVKHTATHTIKNKDVYVERRQEKYVHHFKEN